MTPITPMPSARPQIVIYTDPETKAAIERLAAAEERSVSNWVGRLLRAAIEQASAKKSDTEGGDRP